MPVNYKQNYSLPLLVSTYSTASNGYKACWQAALSEHQHFPSQSNSTQLNPAATQQPSLGQIPWYFGESFLGDRADMENSHFLHVSSFLGTAHAWLTGSPVCLFCRPSSSDSLFITQAHKCQWGKHQHPTNSGQWGLETISINVSHCLHTKWEYLEIFCSVYPKMLFCRKKNVLYSSTYFSD